MSIKITKGAKISRKLDDIQKEQIKNTQKVLLKGAISIHKTATTKISTGTRSGRQRPKGGVSSAPGEFPKTDKAQLVSSMFFKPDGNGAKVGTKLLYGRFLEFGTSKMAARPFLTPSFNMNKAKISKELKRAFEKTNRKF